MDKAKQYQQYQLLRTELFQKQDSLSEDPFQARKPSQLFLGMMKGTASISEMQQQDPHFTSRNSFETFP